MSVALKQLVIQHARRIYQNGDLMLSSNGEPALIAAFAELGWSDLYPLASADPSLAVAVEVGPLEAATIAAPERAVEERPEGHLG